MLCSRAILPAKAGRTLKERVEEEGRLANLLRSIEVPMLNLHRKQATVDHERAGDGDLA